MFTRYVRLQIRLHHASRARSSDLSEIYDFFPRGGVRHHQRLSAAGESACLACAPFITASILTCIGCRAASRDYLSFLGRIAPIKGTHIAIEVAKKSGIPLKIAGEVQPIFQDYFDSQIKPHIDGKFIEYVGEVDLAAKNELLGNSLAMLFPIQWDEPFGLVMIEAMACGTPVLALPGGAVEEVVRDGVSGFVCQCVDEMAQRAAACPGASIREWCGNIASSTSRSTAWWRTTLRSIRNSRAKTVRWARPRPRFPWSPEEERSRQA